MTVMENTLEMFCGAINSATMTVPRAVEVLGVSRAAIYDAIKRGEIKTVKVQDCTLLVKSSVDAYKVTSNHAKKKAKK